jgi:hypothetical protein
MVLLEFPLSDISAESGVQEEIDRRCRAYMTLPPQLQQRSSALRYFVRTIADAVHDTSFIP